MLGLSSMANLPILPERTSSPGAPAECRSEPKAPSWLHRTDAHPHRLRNLALAAAFCLMAISLVLGLMDGRDNARRDLDQRLRTATNDVRADIQNYFERARALNLQLANNPAFAGFYADPRPRAEKIRTQTVAVRQANDALSYIEELYSGRIGEACFIDKGGAENARVVNGAVAKPHELSSDEAGNPFFEPSFGLDPGQVYQAKPYISPDTNELVISNSTLVPVAAGRPAIVHFEVTIESFRRELGGQGAWMRIADAATGEVVADSRFPHVALRPPSQPADTSLRGLTGYATATGGFDSGSDRVQFAKLSEDQSNANRWVVVAAAPIAGFDLTGLLFGWPAAMFAGALVMLGLAGLGFRSYQRELKRQALTDELTGLPNRTLFRDRIDRAVQLARRDNASVAVMIIDVDRFKDVNDTLGHYYGDLLLDEVAKRLGRSVRESDTVARLGGDEFGILLPRVEGPEDVHRVAERIHATVTEPLMLDGVPVQVDVSQGATMFPDHGDDVETLLQRADIAMYDAKTQHRSYLLYDARHDTFTPRRLAMVPQLRLAIERHELDLHYQPRVALDTGIVEGVEALARWEHPTLGRVNPDEFIGLAEDTGLIRALTLSVLDVAIEQAAAWQRDGRPLRVSVNISARNLLDSGFPLQVAERMSRGGLPMRLLQFEITETMLMSDTEVAIETIDALHAMGVGLSIDDFGTGFSSLSYLKRLPVEELKIDRSFVMDLVDNEADASIVRSTIALAKNLGLRVVAEGVETEAALERLIALECDVAQGFLISKPLPADELGVWLDEHRVSPTVVAADPRNCQGADDQSHGLFRWRVMPDGSTIPIPA